MVKALQQKNLLQILAEPNLIAVNGKEASFLAGGEFPFPIVQPGQGFAAVTISFKEFGVKLKFTPVIMPNGNIHLKVAPEVSTLDFTNALTISGFTVPALSTRRAETEFELQDGQSFVIAGLLDNRVTDLYNKIPGLGDIPILGNFFRSKNPQKNQDRADGAVHGAPHFCQHAGRPRCRASAAVPGQRQVRHRKPATRSGKWMTWVICKLQFRHVECGIRTSRGPEIPCPSFQS